MLMQYKETPPKIRMMKLAFYAIIEQYHHVTSFTNLKHFQKAKWRQSSDDLIYNRARNKRPMLMVVMEISKNTRIPWNRKKCVG